MNAYGAATIGVCIDMSPVIYRSMHRTTIVLDDKKLAKVRRVLGTSGIKETVERAFDEILAMELRKRHVERLIKQEGIDLADEDVMAAAWR